MSREERLSAKKVQAIRTRLLQVIAGFGTGLISAFCALVASSHQPDFEGSGLLILSPLAILPLGAVVVMTLRGHEHNRTAQLAQAALFIGAALVGEYCVALLIASADHGYSSANHPKLTLATAARRPCCGQRSSSESAASPSSGPGAIRT